MHALLLSKRVVILLDEVCWRGLLDRVCWMNSAEYNAVASVWLMMLAALLKCEFRLLCLL